MVKFWTISNDNKMTVSDNAIASAEMEVFVFSDGERAAPSISNGGLLWL